MHSSTHTHVNPYTPTPIYQIGPLHRDDARTLLADIRRRLRVELWPSLTGRLIGDGSRLLLFLEDTERTATLCGLPPAPQPAAPATTIHDRPAPPPIAPPPPCRVCGRPNRRPAPGNARHLCRQCWSDRLSAGHARRKAASAAFLRAQGVDV